MRRISAYAVPLLFVAVGAFVIASGAALPAYTNPHWEAPFIGVDVTLENSDELSDQWYAAKAEVETPRHRRLDLGMGLVALGFGFAALFALVGIRSMRDFVALASPSSRRRFYIAAALTWLSFIPAEWFWLAYTQSRGDYPWWADTIAIPAGGVLINGIIGLPIILLGVAIALRGAILPVPLWSTPVFGPPYIASGVFIIAAILALLVIYAGLTDEPFLVPSALFTLYLLLSGRATAVTGYGVGHSRT